MTTKAYFSNRIYKKHIPTNFVESTQHTLRIFNQAKHFRVQEEIRELRGVKAKQETSFHQRIKHRYHLNDYYANSVVQAGKALLSSQQELRKMYLTIKEEQQKATKKKIKTTKSRLTTLRKIKASFVKGKPKFNKTSPEQQKGRYFVVEYKGKTDLYDNQYDFEHLYLDVQLERLESRLGRLTFKLDRIQKQMKTLITKQKGICFGSKKLAKARTTVEHYENNPSSWQEGWSLARYGKMTISGRKDAKDGNYVFHYNVSNRTLTFKTIDDTIVIWDNVTFTYGQENVDKAISTQLQLKDKKKFGQPIGWSLEDHGDYYIVKCLMDVEPTPFVNYAKTEGVIGVDLNVDHFAISSINGIGQLMDSFSMKFDLHGKTSGQVIKMIEAEVIGLVDYAAQQHKPIVIEKLNITKAKVNTPYGNKKANRLKSQFAYKIMIKAIKSRAEKMGVEVLEVNPAYTSQIGKMKYMRRLGISIHEAASFVIARRAMGFKEKLPPVLHSFVPEKKQGLHHWAQWAAVSSSLSFVRVCTFYKIELSDQSRVNKWRSLFPQGALLDF
ncbi:MAG: IS200/IS605 family accessory protein TnpB-related protein, partial [Bacillus sp. (in: Bacteria)]|nr:IS200/IS605 family accessory protein TnpB-related protein [Bacillus sp. (in: firmicutes)]